MIFLIEYDRSRGDLVSIESFENSQRRIAQERRLQRELTLHRNDINREVVILEAVDENQLRRTHLRYFVDLSTLIETELNRLAS